MYPRRCAVTAGTWRVGARFAGMVQMVCVWWYVEGSRCSNATVLCRVHKFQIRSLAKHVLVHSAHRESPSRTGQTGQVGGPKTKAWCYGIKGKPSSMLPVICAHHSGFQTKLANSEIPKTETSEKCYV